MRIFEPHIHMFSRTTDDYEKLSLAGVKGVLEPSFWMGQPRTNLGAFKDYFDTLLGWERFRAQQFGVRHYCTMSLNPKEANDDRVNEKVIGLLEDYIDREGVLGIGEIGFDDMTEREAHFFRVQVDMARDRNKPILIHTPHRDKKQGVVRSLEIVAASGISEDHVLVDHNNEETIPLIKETNCWAAFSIYPGTKMTPERMVEIFRRFGTDRILINSAADWGISDPMLVPKTVMTMRKAGMDDEEIEKVVWFNPSEFFSQSGQISLQDFEDSEAIDRTQRHSGNTVLRGQKP